ncbi:hypothetical protein BH10PSE7_BH10PSE7_32550 [soil metagenome]
MSIEEDLPAKKPSLVVGEDLALLSVAELEHRIKVLESEIVRIRETIAAKESSKSTAASFFRL